MQTMVVADLTAEAFAPFGEVYHPSQTDRRLDHVATLQNGREVARPNLFLSRSGTTALPHRFSAMEQHPWSSQSFLVFGAAPMVVAAALPGQDGLPDLSTLKAFLGRNAGFSYRAGIWHIPVTSLGESVTVAGFMYEDGTPQDCVWADVEPVTLTA